MHYQSTGPKLKVPNQCQMGVCILDLTLASLAALGHEFAYSQAQKLNRGWPRPFNRPLAMLSSIVNVAAFVRISSIRIIFTRIIRRMLPHIGSIIKQPVSQCCSL